MKINKTDEGKERQHKTLDRMEWTLLLKETKVHRPRTSIRKRNSNLFHYIYSNYFYNSNYLPGNFYGLGKG